MGEKIGNIEIKLTLLRISMELKHYGEVSSVIKIYKTLYKEIICEE